MRLRPLSLIFSTLFLLCANSALADERLDTLKNISAAGAPALTLKMLDQAQPGYDADLYEWILWEQERFAILARWQQWDALLLRIEGLPADLPAQFKHQSTSYKVRAYLELGQTSTARKILRAQLWQPKAAEIAEYPTWRQQVITSYLKDNRVEDARIAMLRLNQDFDSQDQSWLLLRATVLMQDHRYQQAAQILGGLKSWQAQLTRLLAQFRAGQLSAKALWSQVNEQSAQSELASEHLASLWVLGYYAAEQMSEVDQVVALEQLFRVATASPLDQFQLRSDRLWNAYFGYARLVGNRAEMLLGDDASWLELADKAAKATPVKSRSLYALLLTTATTEAALNRAAEGYMQTIDLAQEPSQNLLVNLFNRSERYAEANAIPASIRFQLVDLALKKANIDEANRLMSGLSSYPEGTSRLHWQLRHARVLILGGRYEAGSQILQTLISEYETPVAVETDRILQVLFDLQAVKRHEQAIALFNQLIRLPVEPKQRREMLFWIADSYKALEKYDQAALLYLQSAMLPDPLMMDPWAQTARFHAAESLQKSGLVDDARRIYNSLLKVTEEPARRALLNHNIQQLWLNRNQP